MHTACIRVLLLFALGAAPLVEGSGYARGRRAVIKLIRSACGLADKRRVSPHPGHRQACSGCKSIRSCTCRNWKSKLWNFLLRFLGLGSCIRYVCACGTGRGSLVFAWGGSRVAIRRSGVQSRVDSSGRQRWRSSSARKGEET